MARKPRHLGRHLEGHPDWSQLAVFLDARGNRWVAYIKTPNPSGWQGVKLAVIGRVRGKANYWLAWNGARFAAHVEMTQLAENRPELFSALLTTLQERSGLDLI